ncbi:MAG: NAD-dependent epimerase/dehydratase family protein, partial [Cyanobacteria bacterium P01_F01_bin.42]
MDFDFSSAADWYRDRVTQDPLQPNFQTLRNQTLCIMGAAGQVGSHLLAKCYELGFDPTRIDLNDNLSLGVIDNLPPLFQDRLDQRSHREYAESPPRYPDILVFVGGRSSAPHFQSLADVLEEIKTWEIILNWCVQQNIRLIFASTSSLCKQRPSLESQPVWPGSLYELCKLMMENMA